MILIGDRNIKSSLKRLGYNSYDSKIGDVMNKCLHAFVKNESSKRRRYQSGGAETTLPLEYFGVKTGHYFDDARPGVDMAVTDTTIRPAFAVVDPQNTITTGGGAENKFVIPAISIKRACAGLNVSNEQQRAMKVKFENVMQDVLRKAGKKNTGDHLSLTSVQAVLEQKQYQKLFKH